MMAAAATHTFRVERNNADQENFFKRIRALVKGDAGIPDIFLRLYAFDGGCSALPSPHNHEAVYSKAVYDRFKYLSANLKTNWPPTSRTTVAIVRDVESWCARSWDSGTTSNKTHRSTPLPMQIMSVDIAVQVWSEEFVTCLNDARDQLLQEARQQIKANQEPTASSRIIVVREITQPIKTAASSTSSAGKSAAGQMILPPLEATSQFVVVLRLIDGLHKAGSPSEVALYLENIGQYGDHFDSCFMAEFSYRSTHWDAKSGHRNCTSTPITDGRGLTFTPQIFPTGLYLSTFKRFQRTPETHALLKECQERQQRSKEVTDVYSRVDHLTHHIEPQEGDLILTPTTVNQHGKKDGDDKENQPPSSMNNKERLSRRTERASAAKKRQQAMEEDTQRLFSDDELFVKRKPPKSKRDKRSLSPPILGPDSSDEDRPTVSEDDEFRNVSQRRPPTPRRRKGHDGGDSPVILASADGNDAEALHTTPVTSKALKKQVLQEVLSGPRARKMLRRMLMTDGLESDESEEEAEHHE